MIDIKLDDNILPLQDGESVLEGLLRHGIEVSHGCRAGACQACLLQALAGELPRGAQAGLKSTQKSLGLFLSCQCKPTGPLEICFSDQGAKKVSARVIDKALIGNNILRVRLEKVLDFRAGQYLNIWNGEAGNTLIRSYSIASVPQLEDFIELHIKIIANGRFSRWAADAMESGDQLMIQGPLGDCFYTPGDPQQPLLFMGIGTGLAPLYGILRDALQQGHEGDISLVLGARAEEGFYLREALARLQRDYSQLKVHFVCQSPSAFAGDVDSTDIYSFVKQQFPNTKGMKVYLCGADSFVRKMKKQVFMSGAAMNDIHADAFFPCG
jgi:CDP-4-dehydro-6-deoxyglucose reductase